MELTLDTFNRGLANRIRPHLLDRGFAQSVRDADIVDGSLRPFRGVKEVPYSGPLLSYQNDAGTRSIEKWGDYYYWSDNDTGELGSSIGYLGVLPPQGKATAVPEVEGDRFKGDYQYLFTFSTRNGYESSAFPLSLDIDEATVHVRTSYDSIVVAEAAELFSPKANFGAIARKRYGYAGGDIVSYNGRHFQATHSFVAEYEISKTSPRYLPLQPWQYPDAITGKQFWYDLGATETVTVAGRQRIEISRIPQPTEAAVNKINIYRTVSNGSNFYLLTSVATGTRSYRDETPDSSLLNGRQLRISPTQPPIYIDSHNPDSDLVKVGGKYLTEKGGIFYLAYEDRVYLSEAGDPHSWNPNHYVTLGDTVTALAREDRGVVAMTKNRTYHIVGTTPADISARWVPNYQGCGNWRTVAYIHDMPVWLSNDGLTMFGYGPEVNVERLSVVTERKYSFPEDITHAAVANDVYYAFRSNGIAVCVDFRRDLAIYERTLSSDFAITDHDNDRLLLRHRSRTYEVGAGGVQTWTWRSPEMAMASRGVSADALKKVRSIYVNSDSDFTLRAYADGVLHTEVLGFPASKRSNRVYTRGLFGHHLSIEIESAGEVRHIAIEYFQAQHQR